MAGGGNLQGMTETKEGEREETRGNETGRMTAMQSERITMGKKKRLALSDFFYIFMYIFLVPPRRFFSLLSSRSLGCIIMYRAARSPQVT